MNLRYRFQDYLNLTTHTALGMGLRTWFQLLWKNRFSIDFNFWPKAFFITGTSIFNSPVHALEKFRFSKKIKNTTVEPPIFILGHHRSGTTFLHYLLSKDPNFAFCTTTQGLLPNTFLSVGKVAEKFLQAFMPETRPQDNVRAGALLPIEEEFALGNMANASWVHGLYFPRQANDLFDDCVIFNGDDKIKSHWKQKFEFLLKKLSLINPGKTLLLKSPANTARVKEILEVFPNAKFIHIHRNPYEVYLSNERLYEKILPLLALQKVDNAWVIEHILKSYEKMHRKYLNDRALLSNSQLIEFSYADFVVDPIKKLKQAYSQLGLHGFEEANIFFQQELISSKGYVKNKFEDLDETVRKTIADRWGFVFEAFGYEK
jgi:omega-hydroxy-beta-dihydromenaquinone-9 sulfotransferase